MVQRNRVCILLCLLSFVDELVTSQKATVVQPKPTKESIQSWIQIPALISFAGLAGMGYVTVKYGPRLWAALQKQSTSTSASASAPDMPKKPVDTSATIITIQSAQPQPPVL